MGRANTQPSQWLTSLTDETAGDPLFEALPYPIFGLSADHNFIFANYAAEVFFERSRTMLLKSQLADFFLDDSPIFGLLRRLASGMPSVGDQEMTLVSPRIGKKLVTIYMACLPQDSGYIVSLHMRDMADQLRGQSLSRGAALSMSKMTSLLAHEIKNPLAGIKGAAQLIELDGNDEQIELSQLIVEEADRIADLLSRIESMAGAGKLNFAPLNVHEVISHVISVTKASFGAHITIESEFDPSLPDIMGDKALLIQAFLNLLKNACEACDSSDASDSYQSYQDQSHLLSANETDHYEERTEYKRQKGLVKITTSYAIHNFTSASAQSREKFLPLQIDIVDNGKGISEDLREILFEPFISNKAEGSGLGLAVVASAVADHGGVVSVQSQEGETHFQILLPLTPQTPPNEKMPKEADQ